MNARKNKRRNKTIIINQHDDADLFLNIDIYYQMLSD